LKYKEVKAQTVLVNVLCYVVKKLVTCIDNAPLQHLQLTNQDDYAFDTTRVTFG
jgi:hypothetical protein